MAARSAEFLEADNEQQHAPSLHRTRSGGYTDQIEEREKWERHGREREMKRYHDQKLARNQSGRISSDRLYVPTFEPAGHRRVRSHGEIKETLDTPAREYNVREAKPSFAVEPESPKTSQLPIRAPRSPQQPQQRRPTITVEVHQSDMPKTPSRQPSVRKSASPRSPSALPALLVQFANLQNKFSEICTICARNFHVEPANPHDLTFFKIAEEIRGHAFSLQVWEHLVNLKNLERIDRSKRKVVELAAKTLDRLSERTSELSECCEKARPRDLKFEPPSDLEDGSERESSEDEEDDVVDVTLSLGFEIRSHLESITLQISTLSRLTRPLQEAAPQAAPEVDAVADLVDDVDRFFGSSQALHRYSIDTRFAGKKALDEAKHKARQSQ